MTALPSFEDLMASLGLDPDSERIRPPNARPRSATLSPNPNGNGGLRISRHGGGQSKSISSLRDLDVAEVDRNDQLPTPPESARLRSRYSPYGIEESRKANANRGANSGSSTDRNGSTSPPSNKFQRRLLPRLEKASDDLSKLVPDLPADAPISMYARRNTPQASPISPSYARPGHHPFLDFSSDKLSKRQKSSSPPLPPLPHSAGMPIALPTVPILLRQPSPRSSRGSSPRDSTRLTHRTSYNSFQRERNRNVMPVA